MQEVKEDIYNNTVTIGHSKSFESFVANFQGSVGYGKRKVVRRKERLCQRKSASSAVAKKEVKSLCYFMRSKIKGVNELKE